MTNRPQRPKFLWNNAYLQKLAIELGDECIFLCLSPVSFRMLADMSKMLLWATRYEGGEVSELGITAYRELNVPCLEDFYSRLDELNNTDWLQSQFDDLGQRMTELEDMDINVIQTVSGCGCGCDGDTTPTSTTTTIPTFGEMDTGEIPAYDTDIVTVEDSEQCRAANYLAHKVVSMIRGLGNMGTGAATVAGIVTILMTIVAWLTPIPGDEIISTSALFYYAFIFANGLRTGSFVLDVFNNLADSLEADMQAFVCALYDWDTAEDLGNTLTAIVDDKIDEVVPMLGLDQEASTSLKTILDGLFGSQLVNWFVGNVSTIIPADFVSQYDCICGATGDYCPDTNIVLAAVGNLPSGDLTGTTQGFASQFNSSNGYHEIIFELAANYCVSIDYGDDFAAEMHEVCSDGAMVAADGDCIRRFMARSSSPFATAVTFLKITDGCLCDDPDAQSLCLDYSVTEPGVLQGGGTTAYVDGEVKIDFGVLYNSVPQWYGGVNVEDQSKWGLENEQRISAVYVKVRTQIELRVSVTVYGTVSDVDLTEAIVIPPTVGWVKIPIDNRLRYLRVRIYSDAEIVSTAYIEGVCVDMFD